jgi:hypothetical protein
MPRAPDRGPTAPSMGCRLVMATPFLLFGLIMLAVTYGQLTGGAGAAAIKYGMGALVGLVLGVGLLRARAVEDGEQISKRAPFAFYYVMGGLLVLGGLSALRSALVRHQGGAADEAMALGTLAAFLLVMGAWFVIGGRIQTRRDAPLVAALQRGAPEPWRYVAGWADGKVRDTGASALGRGAFAAVVANLVAWPLAIGRTLSSDQPAGPLDLTVWLLPLGALALTIGIARGIRRRMRLGGMTFTMDTFPGVVGGRLDGTVWARTDLQDTGGARLTATLTSLRRKEIRRSDSGAQMHQLWQQRQTVPARLYQHDGARYAGIPVSFHIPLSASPTTLDDPSDRVLWRLEIESDSPALPARAAMEVPVFDLRDDAERAQEVPLLPDPAPSPNSPAPLPRAWAERIDRTPADTSTDAAPDALLPPPPAQPAARLPGAPTDLLRRLFPAATPHVAMDEEQHGRVTITSESGDPRRSATGLALAALSVLGLLLIVAMPALQQVDGIGLLPIASAAGGAWLWFSYRHRKAQVVLSAFDVTLRGWAVKHGEVMLQYAELERASVESGSERSTPPQTGTTTRSIRGFDVVLTARDGRCYVAGLHAGDRQQAQWVAGHINRRIAAAGPVRT